MNKGPNTTIRLVRRQNHAGTTVSWTTVQREKSSHAYKLSSNVQTACSTDSLNNCPKHSILRFSSFALKIYLWLKMCQHNLPCSIVYAHCLLPRRAFASLYVLLFLEKEAVIGGRASGEVATYRSSLPGSKLGTALFIYNCQIASFLFLYFTSSRGGLIFSRFYFHYFIGSCQRRLLLSADNLCKQFVPRSVPTERWSWSGYRPFDTLIVFLNDALKKVNFENKSADDNKSIKIIQRAKNYYFVE